VLEFLLGQYCSSDDDSVIEDGVRNVKRILSDNFVRPDEAQKVLSSLRERGSYTVIDRITVSLNIKIDRYEADFSNLGVRGIPMSSDYVSKYDRLLCGGIWCIVGLEYEYNEEEKKIPPIRIQKVTPIQMPHIDMDEIKNGRRAFTKDEWITILLRSTGMEANRFSEREKWLLLARMLPLIENNFNLCELGPRSTGKSHLYKEISPNSILVSGGQTTVANLFYNMASKTVGLVGLWDCVAFDEVAGITFKDKDGVQIMKDYMASGSFARGKEEKAASASMVFVGNINQSVDVMLKTSHLFDPFPDAMAYDTAFLDRMHCYVPGWEIPKYRPNFFTDDYGFITDYLSEFMREMRKEPFGDVCDKYFRFGTNLNQRDVIAVRKMVSGFTKLLYPNGEFTKDEIQEILTISLEMRRRVKEQLKKIGGMEFYDVNFSYIDNESFEEHYVSVPEQGGGKIIPEGLTNPGNVYTVSQGKTGMIGVYRLETQGLPGNGKFERTGLGNDRDAKEATNTAFNYLKANGHTISSSLGTTTRDFIVNYQDLNGIGMTKYLTLPTVIALASSALNKPTLSSLAVLGEISISGTILKVDELASVLQVCLDSGAKKVLIPITSAPELGTVPADLMSAFSLIFYSTPQEAVYKALGVE
jgi:ATP-dependent Lon protease